MIRGGVRIEDVFVGFFRALGRDGAKQLLGELLHRPIWIERGAKKVGDEVIGRHNGITRFVRLCHSGRNSFSNEHHLGRIHHFTSNSFLLLYLAVSNAVGLIFHAIFAVLNREPKGYCQQTSFCIKSCAINPSTHNPQVCVADL